MLSLQSAWNVFGAPTKLAKAEDRVAAKIPPVTIGPQAAIFSITCWEKTNISLQEKIITVRSRGHPDNEN